MHFTAFVVVVCESVCGCVCVLLDPLSRTDRQVMLIVRRVRALLSKTETQVDGGWAVIV